MLVRWLQHVSLKGWEGAAGACRSEVQNMPPREAHLDDVVHGVGLDAQSRCAHYHGPVDIVAIRFKCCGAYYACKDCHAALADHPIQVWPEEQWDEKAIRCGACGDELTIRAYLNGSSMCPACGAGFNPRCHHHHQFYFAGHETARPESEEI